MTIPGAEWLSSSTIDPLILLLAALAAEALLGEARGPLARLPHPVRLIGALIDLCDRKLNDRSCSARTRRWRGVLTVVLVMAAAAAAGGVIVLISRALPFGCIIEVTAVVSLLAQRSLYRHVRAVAVALGGSLEAGRAAVSHIVGRDVARLDRAGVARAAIESCAENFSDAVVAPVFWYVLLGLPGLCVYKAVNTLDSMIGHRSLKYLAFGMPSARLDDALNLIPARLAGLYVVIAAAADPRTDARRAWRTMRNDAKKHRSPNAGWPEASMAGALGLALAGPRQYPMVTVDDPWLGDGSAAADVPDIWRALDLFRLACVVNALVIAVLVVIRLSLS
ncbi:MAG: adenosylcobinamide-phosphate synthase CbiB [Rhodospirillales bacterium]